MNKTMIVLAVALGALSSCKDLIKPAIENNRTLDSTIYAPSDARFPYGVLLNGYTRIPTNNFSFNDVATDDAVSNDKNNNYSKIATGQWTATNNPTDQWTNAFAAIQYLNIMLGEADKVQWAADQKVSPLFAKRVKGEAYGLRALFLFHLLRAHAGVSESGALLGVPIITDPQSTTTNFNKPRATFADCIKQIYSDLDKAEELLPLDFEDIANAADIPPKYGTGFSREDFNRVFGSAFRGFLTARIAKALRAQAALLAASPAYNNGNVKKWEDAAKAAAAVLNLKGGLGALAANGVTWYTNTSEIDGLADGANPAEILWRSNWVLNRDLEQANQPPTLYGNGRINPSQNLVDAFPMANGFPITDPASGYDPNAPYNNRDPRLKTFILVNGGTAGPNNSAINTAADGPTNDALNKVETSTRTGYYMRKLLRQDVNLNPTSANNQKHYTPHIRYTEILLIYAEAANEAWGPTGTGGNTFSAYDVIRAIRKRAGVGVNSDPYLDAAKGSQDAMRALIRNERRLELCFEGFRFWDLRRWSSSLTETANGVSIKNGAFTKIAVENRVYQNFMQFGPVPYSEILKFSSLEQNKGWR